MGRPASGVGGGAPRLLWPLLLLLLGSAHAGFQAPVATRRHAARRTAAAMVAPPPEAEGGVRLTGDPAADKMILQKLKQDGAVNVDVAKLRREDMAVAKGRSTAEVAVGANAA